MRVKDKPKDKHPSIIKLLFLDTQGLVPYGTNLEKGVLMLFHFEGGTA